MRAAILAGGRGTRLAPYTTVLPKPLVPVGDRPILKLILRQLSDCGVDRVDRVAGGAVAGGHGVIITHPACDCTHPM